LASRVGAPLSWSYATSSQDIREKPMVLSKLRMLVKPILPSLAAYSSQMWSTANRVLNSFHAPGRRPLPIIFLTLCRLSSTLRG
jgi:hypothetical protein